MSIEKFGKPLFANIIVLGLLTAHCEFLDMKVMEDLIRETVPAKAVDQNIDALKMGFEYKV